MTPRSPDCDAARRLLAPYLDGELVNGEAASVEAHLTQCDDCRALFASEAEVAAAIAGGVPRHRAPASLGERVGRMVEVRSRLRRWPVVAAAAAAVLAIAALAWRLVPSGTSEPRPRLVAVAVDSHLRYADGRLPLEVRSDRPDEVSRWFEGRVPFHVTIPDYPVSPGEQKFYTLEGARLVTVGGEYAAYLAYRMDGRPISLLIASADTVSPSGRDTVTWGHLTFHCESAAGLKVITWSDNGLTYALASDVASSSERSCMVCHGTPSERRKIEGFAPGT
jgi:anti-sigma factor RsiW